MVTDVTPLKQAEEALREKESVLRSFYESSVMAMGVVELTEDDTRFVSANALTDKFFGVAPGKLEGKTARELKAPPEMLRDLDRAVPRVPGDRPAGPVRVPGNLPEQPGMGRGHALADGLAGLGTAPLLVHRRRHHRPQADRGRPASKPRSWPRRLRTPRIGSSPCSATSSGRR